MQSNDTMCMTHETWHCSDASNHDIVVLMFWEEHFMANLSVQGKAWTQQMFPILFVLGLCTCQWPEPPPGCRGPKWGYANLLSFHPKARQSGQRQGMDPTDDPHDFWAWKHRSYSNHIVLIVVSFWTGQIEDRVISLSVAPLCNVEF
jgi:hypothetical protein